LLYAQTFNESDIETFEESFFEGDFKIELDKKYLNTILDIIYKYEFCYNDLIKKYFPKFDISSMDLSFIFPCYIWLSEMFVYEEEIPAKVIMNESIEISKFFGSDSSKKMVNGFLNNVYKEIDVAKDFILNYDFSLKKESIFIKK